jgi:hypothetical protein
MNLPSFDEQLVIIRLWAVTSKLRESIFTMENSAIGASLGQGPKNFSKLTRPIFKLGLPFLDLSSAGEASIDEAQLNTQQRRTSLCSSAKGAR